MAVSSLDVYLFAVASAVFRGVDPIVSKRGLEGGGNWLQNTLVVLAVRVAVFWSVLLVASGAHPLRGVTLRTIAVFAFAGVLAAGVGQLAFYLGVARVGSSVSTTVTNSRPLFAVALAVLWLGELVTPVMGLGVLVLVAGLFVISVSKGGDISGWRRIDLAFPLLAAVAFAGGNVVRRFGFTTETVSVVQALAINDLAAFAAVAGYAVAAGRLDALSAPRRSYGLFAVAGLLVGAAMLLLFEALARGPVSVVDPIVATAPLFTALVASVLLRDVERITRGLVVGTVLVVVGVALITGGLA